MCALVLNVLIFLGIFFCIHALTCRSDGGPKEEELKTIYMNCLKNQRNSSNKQDRKYTEAHSSREKRKQNHGSQWGRREGGSFGSRDEWSGSDWGRSRDNHDSNSRTQSRDDWSSSQDDRMSSRNDRTSNNRERVNMNNRERINGRDDFVDNDDYDSETQSYGSGYRSSTQQSRRMKREKSSGHRSQYNPNPTKSPGREDSYRNNERNSSENSTNNDNMDYNKACALHCFLDELEMTGENGMPDRYLVTQVITKDVKNEDLRDFLQESIEECFQILYNENSHDKCEFSKNLLMCLSEKGQANCDDWKDDSMKF